MCNQLELVTSASKMKRKTIMHQALHSVSKETFTPTNFSLFCKKRKRNRCICSDILNLYYHWVQTNVESEILSVMIQVINKSTFAGWDNVKDSSKWHEQQLVLCKSAKNNIPFLLTEFTWRIASFMYYFYFVNNHPYF